MKKSVLMALFLVLAIACSALVFAPEAQQLPEGVKQIQGEKGVTEYNADEITAIFGAAPVADNGALKIKYKDARGRTRDFGTVTGKIEKAADNTIGLTKITVPGTSLANYLSPESSEKGIDVKGVKFAINASKRTEDKFGFILVTDMAFQIDESTGRDIRLEEKAVACKGQCKISAEMSPSELVFNIKNGTLLFKEDVIKFMRGELISLPSVNMLELSGLKILPAAEGSEEPVLAVSAYSGGLRFASVFDTIKFESGQEVELMHSKMHDIGRNRFIGDEIFNSINLKEGKVLVQQNADIRLNAGASSAVEVFMPAATGTARIAGLKKGRLIITGDETDYYSCVQMDNTGCFSPSASSGMLKINPEMVNMELFDPAANGFNSLYFERFITGDLVVVSKAGKELIFADNRVDISPAGDWFEFGLSFNTYPITYHDEETGQTTEYRFRCDINTRKCYFVTPPSGPEQEVVSFTERRPVQCTEDSDCGTGKICAEYRCRIPVTCDKLIDGGSVDLLFVSEGYTDYEDFKREVRKLVEIISFKGFFTVSPFSEIKSKFTVWAVKGVSSSQLLDKPGALNDYIADYESQCSHDIAIALSKNQAFRAHANSATKRVAVSMQDMNEDGNALTFVHEMGHAYADLKDEYLSPKSLDDPSLLSVGSTNFAHVGAPNCFDEQTAILQWGSAQWAGCGGDCNKNTDECARLGRYFRPEDNSIMRDQTVSGAQFNEVSKQAIRDVGSLGAVAMDPMVLARIRQEATGQ